MNSWRCCKLSSKGSSTNLRKIDTGKGASASYIIKHWLNLGHELSSLQLLWVDRTLFYRETIYRSLRRPIYSCFDDSEVPEMLHILAEESALFSYVPSGFRPNWHAFGFRRIICGYTFAGGPPLSRKRVTFNYRLRSNKAVPWLTWSSTSITTFRGQRIVNSFPWLSATPVWMVGKSVLFHLDMCKERQRIDVGCGSHVRADSLFHFGTEGRG